MQAGGRDLLVGAKLEEFARKLGFGFYELDFPNGLGELPQLLLKAFDEAKPNTRTRRCAGQPKGNET